jgi:hypothetical protein
MRAAAATAVKAKPASSKMIGSVAMEYPRARIAKSVPAARTISTAVSLKLRNQLRNHTARNLAYIL